MKFTASKKCNSYFSLKQHILVEIPCLFSLDFCPSKQQVNGCIKTTLRKWGGGGQVGKASHKKRNHYQWKCEIYSKTANKISLHPDNSVSATCQFKRNEENKISSLGHSTGKLGFQCIRTRSRVQAWGSVCKRLSPRIQELRARQSFELEEKP